MMDLNLELLVKKEDFLACEDAISLAEEVMEELKDNNDERPSIASLFNTVENLTNLRKVIESSGVTTDITICYGPSLEALNSELIGITDKTELKEKTLATIDASLEGIGGKIIDKLKRIGDGFKKFFASNEKLAKSIESIYAGGFKGEFDKDKFENTKVFGISSLNVAVITVNLNNTFNLVADAANYLAKNMADMEDDLIDHGFWALVVKGQKNTMIVKDENGNRSKVKQYKKETKTLKAHGIDLKLCKLAAETYPDYLRQSNGLYEDIAKAGLSLGSALSKYGSAQVIEYRNFARAASFIESAMDAMKAFQSHISTQVIKMTKTAVAAHK